MLEEKQFAALFLAFHKFCGKYTTKNLISRYAADTQHVNFCED